MLCFFGFAVLFSSLALWTVIRIASTRAIRREYFAIRRNLRYKPGPPARRNTIKQL